MGFTTYYAVLVHHLNFHLRIFSQTTQGTSFTKLINDWEKMYGYGNKFTKSHFDQLTVKITIADNKRCQAPGYNKANDIIDGQTLEVLPQPMVLSGQEMLEKYFFVGFESAPGLDKYPPLEIESSHHINNYPTTRNDNVTITAIVQSTV